MKQPYDPVQTEDNIWNAFITKELKQHIASEVDKMPEKMRHIYLLSKEARLTNAEIASLLNLSNQTVKNQLHNALKRLRQSLANTNFSFSFPLSVIFSMYFFD